MIQRLKEGKFADGDVDPFMEDWPSSFEKEIEIHPLSNRPEDKRSFIPSKWERLKVSLFLFCHAIIIWLTSQGDRWSY